MATEQEAVGYVYENIVQSNSEGWLAGAALWSASKEFYGVGYVYENIYPLVIFTQTPGGYGTGEYGTDTYGARD